jgi:hypothetical protein
VRLLTTILWCLAALLWLPWALLVIRLGIDLALGIPPGASDYLRPALVGVWPVHGWSSWGVVSWWPLAALAAMGLSALGWRLYWLDLDGLLPRGPRAVVLSISFPIAAPFLMYGDARRRHREKQQRLAQSTEEALEHISS